MCKGKGNPILALGHMHMSSLDNLDVYTIRGVPSMCDFLIVLLIFPI